MSADTHTPNTAMVLAAGLGKRMRSFSSKVSKPMVEVAGISLINRVLNKLDEAKIAKAVVNLHHKADQLEEHLNKRTSEPTIVFSFEKHELLETGGGVKNALPLLGEDAFFVINSDALWDDGETGALANMQSVWDEEKMDVLLLVYDTEKLANYSGNGDFYMDEAGVLTRPNDAKPKPFIFTGVQIINPALMAQFPDGIFSLNKVYDKANLAGRLYGVSHSGMWHHVGSGEEVQAAEKYYAQK